MYKYVASKSQRKYWLIADIYYIAGFYIIGLLIYEIFNHDLGKDYLILMIIPCTIMPAGTVELIRTHLTDPLLGKMSFDHYAVTMYTPKRTITIPYMECAEVGLTLWHGAGGPVCYVYLSKKPLSFEQMANLFLERLRKKKRVQGMPAYIDDYVLFQYTPDVFSEFVKYIPESLKEKVVDEAQEWELAKEERKAKKSRK